MGKQGNGKLIAYLPLVVAATFAVVIVPMLLVVWLRESGAVTSMWVALVIGVVLSLLASQAAAWVWQTRTNSDLLFSELMLWGWVQRWRSERRLAVASDLLGLTAGRPEAITGGHLTSAQKEALLTQITSSLETSDPYTHGHSRRVARHAANIAKKMGLSREEVAKIRAAGAMHDVGKVETPTAVLHKAGKLTEEEYDLVKRHPVDGANMVATLDDDELTAIVRHHHERLDGTGYPDGLAGDEIPLGARILAVADTFDAITSTRPYRRSNPHKKALDILAAEAGTQLDPDAVSAFRACYSGRKPLAFWAVLVNSRPRVEYLLGQVWAPASAPNVLTTAATAAAVGAVAVGPVATALPDSPDAVRADNAAHASTGPLSRSMAPRTTTFASFVREPAAIGASGRSKPSEVNGASGPSGRDPGAAGGSAPNGDSAPTDSRRHAAGDVPNGADEPAGGPRDDGSNGSGHSGKGNGHGNENAGSNGKANGQGQGNGNSQGPSKGNGPTARRQREQPGPGQCQRPGPGQRERPRPGQRQRPGARTWGRSPGRATAAARAMATAPPSPKK